MNNENEEVARTRDVQRRTCVCCRLVHDDKRKLEIHLHAMATKVAWQLEQMVGVKT